LLDTKEAKIAENLDEPIPRIEDIPPLIKNRNVTDIKEVPGSFCDYSQMLHDLCMAHPYMIEMLQAEYPNILDSGFSIRGNRPSSLEKPTIQHIDFDDGLEDSWKILESISFTSVNSCEISDPNSEKNDVYKTESMLDTDCKNPVKDMCNISSQLQDTDYDIIDSLLMSTWFSASTSASESQLLPDLILESDENLHVKVDSLGDL
jgi:hypothetical protein